MNTISGQTFDKPAVSADGFTHVLYLNGVKDTIYKNCKFLNDNVKLDSCSNVIFEACEFAFAKRTSGAHHALNCGKCPGLQVIGCNFHDFQDWMQLYQVGGLVLDSNKVTTGSYGCKISLGPDKNFKITNNDLRHLRAMGFELQYDSPGADGLLFRGNSYTDADRWSDDNNNAGATMAFSIPLLYTTNVVVDTNYASGLCNLIDQPGHKRQSSKTWLGVRVGIEGGGNGGQFLLNWIEGLNDPVSMVPASSNCNVHDNLVKACLELANMQGNGNAGTNRFTNNNDTVILPKTGGWNLTGAIPPGGVTPPQPPVEIWTDVFTGTIQKSDQAHYRVK